MSKPKVEIICPKCLKPRSVSYKYAHSKNKNRLCNSCSAKVSWESEGYREKSSKAHSTSSTEKWKDPAYRATVIANLPPPIKKPKKITIKCPICGTERLIGRRYAQRKQSGIVSTNRPCMSCSMKNKWEKQEYRKHISKLVGDNTKKLWLIPEFRKAVTESNSTTWSNKSDELSKRALKLWQSEIYRAKTKAGMNTQEAREKLALARASQSGRISSIQTMLYTFLDELGIEYYKESEQTRVGYYVFDCLIINGNKKLLIECQGDYWHSLPRAEQNDKSKFTYINRYFPEYEIMYIWEHEFYCKDRVLDRLKLKLGLDIETKEFDFKDLTIREINSIETKTFLDLYHYLGKDRGGKAFGAFYGNLLIAVIVFSSPLRQNTAGQFGLADDEVRELSRLCIHPSYHKKNFASWFIKRVLKQIKCKLIVAYADTTVGHQGTIYKAANFKLHHVVPADYWYVDKQGYVMHKRTLYGKAINLKMTEYDFAEAKGYLKKYGGEKLCFIKEC
jgi:hypothetical protein